MKGKKLVFMILIILVLAVYMIGFLSATFAGSHTIVKKKNSSSFGNATLCYNCHPGEVEYNNQSVHRSSGCTCHGYAPSFNINEKHNLSVKLYCTNCHASYDSNGTFETHTGVNTSNQSAHYIMKNSSMWVEHAKKFFP